ncbi:hypothetical protein [Stenotrophomonas sp. YAU14D1_LEIMI4_1]|uniref:hypothetical protein n=1 Tax=Stenotrophomonas sp. YAU14D1_LEIMI4_1 TaxID=2072407 RepID=UPI000D5421E7|nr:hypothetical protein [Stenotrophomonas sp. YAU14D1_LEIMI4_1]AWH26778.1 hypothetical protein C1932_17545 [Stenotrophomonas sp. YAU14D1_LEIMI4_1]
MSVSLIPTHLQMLGIPLWPAILATLLCMAVGWFFRSPMDNFHRWRESKLRDREFLLKVANQSDDALEAARINEDELQSAFLQRHGIQAGAEERRTYSNLVRRYSPSIKWRHIRGISSLARRSADGNHIELHMPVWQRRFRYGTAIAGIALYLTGSFLWLGGLVQAVHGSWAGIIVGAPLAIVAAVTTRASLFPLQSYNVVAGAIHGEYRTEVLRIAIPESIKGPRATAELVTMDSAARRSA